MAVLMNEGVRMGRNRVGRLKCLFVQQLWLDGKTQDLPIGNAMFVTLKEARAIAQENYKLARAGGDPRQAKATQAEVKPICPTFKEIAEDAGLSDRAISDLRRHAFGIMGGLPVNEVTPKEALAFAEVLWADKPTTAVRGLQTICKVLARAKVQGHRADSFSAKEILAGLPANGHKATKQPAMAHSEVSKALAKVRQTEKMPCALAIELQVLTAVRPKEAQGARWSEIDLDAKLWTILGERMKAKREHRVPLSDRAISILRVAKDYSVDDCVFPGGEGGKAQRTQRAMQKLAWASDQPGRVAVAHGFRSSFRNWAGEESGASHDAIERALAHEVGNSVEQKYFRSDLLEKRRPLMQAWADYLTK